jgi:hypothetical protein
MSISGKNKPKIYKIILNIETGIFYNGIIEAAIAHNIGHSSLKSMLNGQRKNKTNLIYTYEF